MQMYKEYLEETIPGKSCIFDDKGFASYYINGEECYIVDIFVKKEHRQSYMASEYANKIVEIAKDNGCKYLTGSVACENKQSERSMKVLLNYGFKLHSTKGNTIYFLKEIK